MPTAVNRIGEKFGLLTVVSKSDKGPRSHWICKCECGGEVVVSNSNLVTGNTVSCGCAWTKAVKKEMVGRRFGSLVVIEEIAPRQHGNTRFAAYRCKCDCGGSIETIGMSLRNGDTVSCGCSYKIAGLRRVRSEEHKREVLRFHIKRRRAVRIRAFAPFDREFFDLMEREAYRLCRERTRTTGVRFEVDHIVPLRSKVVCGLHNEHNLRVIPAIENNRKGNRRWPDMPE